MKSLKVQLLVCVSILAVTGCPQPHGSPAITPASAQRIFRLPWEKVWIATMAVLTEDLDLPVEEVVPKQGMIATKWVTFKSQAANFRDSTRPGPHGEKGPPILVEYKVVVLVKISPEGTMVRARRYQREFRKRWQPLPTDLSFERQLLSLVAARLGAVGP